MRQFGADGDDSPHQILVRYEVEVRPRERRVAVTRLRHELPATNEQREQGVHRAQVVGPGVVERTVPVVTAPALGLTLVGPFLGGPGPPLPDETAGECSGAGARDHPNRVNSRRIELAHQLRAYPLARAVARHLWSGTDLLFARGSR